MKNYYLMTKAAMALMIALFCCIGAQAEVVTVGEGTTASSYVPCYPNNNYSLSQQIYTADEIGRAGQITSIAFYNYDVGSDREVNIYLTHTAKTAFDSSTDWVAVSTEDLVFSGTINLKGGWTAIDFDTPFVYNGTQNLILTFDDNTGESTGSNYLVGNYDGASNQALYYYSLFSTPANLDPTQAIDKEGSIYYRKSRIKLCFETYPKPARFEAVEVGDVSAQLQCVLRGGAEKWNLRYRKAAKEGEQELRWTTLNDLGRSVTIEGLTPATKYEAQAQAVFTDDNLSEWTDTMIFITNCCPVEEQAEVIYSLYGNYSNWYGFAVQFVDVTDEANPIEVAYLNPPSYELYAGTVTLCCGHKYKVNWIYDANHENVNGQFSVALYFEPGDLFFSMARGQAPGETAELTSFVMDCTPYCAQKPQNVTVTSTSYNSATLTFTSETTSGEVAYGTTADFNPETATPTAVSFETTGVTSDPWESNPTNASMTLSGLEPLTDYYVSVRSVCEDEDGNGGHSRWSVPVKVRTGSRYDGPTQVKAEPISSRIEKLSWSSRGTEKRYNAYYRKHAKGTPVDQSDINTMGGGKGKGFEDWEGVWASYGSRPFSNTLYVSAKAGSSFSFKAANGKSGSQYSIPFIHGWRKLTEKTPLKQMKKLDRECLNDADRETRIKELQDEIDGLEICKEGAKKSLDDGQITQEKYEKDIERYDKQIAEFQEELAALKALPTDDQKLERMRELETMITNSSDKEEVAQYQAELNELRALTSEAAGGPGNMFTMMRLLNRILHPRARIAREESADETFVFFIRHANNDGMLWIKDLTITPPDMENEWIMIPNIEGTSYLLTELEPNTTYEVMVEPIYEDGLTGTPSPITLFTTLGEETEPTPSEFSVDKDKKIFFAHGNLRHDGDIYEGTWTLAPQQYAIFGQDNIEESRDNTYLADYKDLLCWSSVKSHYGVSNYYYYDEEDAAPLFQGEFADWGENPELIANIGPGWRTLAKEEWLYLLFGRKDAEKLRSLATVADVKGLIILPDNWADDTPAGTFVAEEWAILERAGAVFLPAAGQASTAYEDYKATTTLTEGGYYWIGTPSGDKSDMKAFVLSFTDSDVSIDTDLNRRTAVAVRLVKDTGWYETVGIAITPVNTHLSTLTNMWYDLSGRRLQGKPTKKGVFILNGKKVVIK